MNKQQLEMAEKLLNLLEKEKFAAWYNTRFDNYIRVDYPEGHKYHVSKDDILKDIGRFLNYL